MSASTLVACLECDLLHRQTPLPPGGEAHCTRTRVYRVVEFIGRWSMLDIYVVTIMVALVQVSTPGPEHQISCSGRRLSRSTT